MSSKNKSAKSLGFKKGDFVHTGYFPGIIIGDVHTTTPLCEVFGIEQELGGCYSSDLRKLTREEFNAQCAAYGHIQPVSTTKEGKAALSVEVTA